jgi:flagellar basal body rod protein FlgG
MSYAGVMRAQIDRLDTVAQNASNTNSPGYLQQSSMPTTNDFLSLVQAESKRPEQKIFHSREIGSLHITNRNTDVGVVSEDWFMLDGPENLVTRNGRFSISTDGYLQLDNFKVMGESGPISNLSNEFSVRSDGSIYVNDKYIDKLKLVSFNKDQSLQSLGNGLYKVEGGLSKSQAPKVVQGALTGSNVSLESDMTKMIEITRHVEMLQRAMSAYNDMLQVGINQLGK